MIVRSLLLSAIAAASAWAQVGAPLLGYLPDGARIRPVYGIPAAASVAPPVDLGQDFAQITAAPEREYVLASSAESGQVLRYSAAGLTPLAGVGAAPDLIVISPRGTAAALWFASISRAQVASGLPDVPAVRDAVRNIDTPFRPSIPSALAVSDDGSWLAGSWSGGVFAFGPHGEMVSLPTDGRTRALAFAPGTHDLAVANGAGIAWVTGLDTQAAVSSLYDPAGVAFHPVGVAVTSGHVLAADASGTVLSVDLATHAANATPCHCRPEGLFGIAAGVFRLTGIDGGAVRLFDSSSGSVWFAPLQLSEGGAQ